MRITRALIAVFIIASQFGCNPPPQTQHTFTRKNFRIARRLKAHPKSPHTPHMKFPRPLAHAAILTALLSPALAADPASVTQRVNARVAQEFPALFTLYKDFHAQDRKSTRLNSSHRT